MVKVLGAEIPEVRAELPAERREAINRHVSMAASKLVLFRPRSYDLTGTPKSKPSVHKKVKKG